MADKASGTPRAKASGTPRGSHRPIDNKASLAAGKKPALKPTRVAASGKGDDKPPSSFRRASASEGASKSKGTTKPKSKSKAES